MYFPYTEKALRISKNLRNFGYDRPKIFYIYNSDGFSLENREIQACKHTFLDIRTQKICIYTNGLQFHGSRRVMKNYGAGSLGGSPFFHKSHKNIKGCKAYHHLYSPVPIAEEEGFEPSRRVTDLLVFEARPFSHLGTPPDARDARPAIAGALLTREQ